MYKILLFAVVFGIALHLFPHAFASERNSESVPLISLETLKHKIAQQLFIDLRYFCSPAATGYCQTSMTTLPSELSEMLSEAKIGGVILFSENLTDTKQILTLNNAIQSAILSNQSSNQLSNQSVAAYIGIDQEGGRVSRLPQNEYLGFAGNMAIGATYAKHDIYFAEAVATEQARQLKSLGFNVNFAPVLDVNNNPENPVINVRSYSQFPEVVTHLGQAAIAAMQSNGIAGAAKHFPGHGDTKVDSHVGLPKVEHTPEVIHAVDLAPFKHVISSEMPSAVPHMIMTAHIQYPSLDNTSFQTKTGKKTILPATLSKKILTGLLREQLGYQGLIVTDALDMAAISQFLQPKEAVIKAIDAGADITLMPYRISSPEQAKAFITWLDELSREIAQKPDLMKKVEASYQRIIAHKKRLGLYQVKVTDLPQSIEITDASSTEYQQQMALAQSLSSASVTSIKPISSIVKPSYDVLAFMPDKLRCASLLDALAKKTNRTAQTSHKHRCYSMLSEDIPSYIPSQLNVGHIIVGESSPSLAFYESKDDENITAAERKNMESQFEKVNALVALAKQNNIDNSLLKMRSPYVSEQQMNMYAQILATFDYQVVKTDTGELFSPVFSHVVDILYGDAKAEGSLPTMPLTDNSASAKTAN